MRQQWGLVASVAFAVALCLLPAAADAKQKSNGAVMQCQQRVADRIRAGYSPARSLSFNRDVQWSSRGKHGVTISGSGRVHMAKHKKRGFSYNCVYNRGAVTKVKYSVR
jgi:hypothetical protein